jgi:tight adherence protein C
MVLLLSALMMLLAAGLLIGTLAREQRRRQLVARRLQGELASASRLGGLLASVGGSRLGQRSVSLDSETSRLLNRIGWRKASQRSLFAALQLGLPVLAVLLALLVQGLLAKPPTQPWGWLMLAAGIGYLLPKRLLAWAAERRRKQIAEQVSTFIALLRILFESGLAVEQALRVLSYDARGLLPELTAELRQVLVRVDSGLELSEELRSLALLIDVEEFSDTCVILQQLIQQGGGAMKSLMGLKQVLDDRRLTRMQEYISKLSAKMSIVMMVFLFPALLIVLAGPGFTAIARAFKTL